MELLQELMNKGFLIYQNDTTFVLKKIPTPADSRHAITDEVVSDTSVIACDSFNEAISKAKKLCEWKDPVDPSLTWRVQFRYQHRGLGIKIDNLDDIVGVAYPEALDIARRCAAKIADKDDLIEDGWEVKVFPAR